MSTTDQIAARIFERLDCIEHQLNHGPDRAVYDAAGLRRMGIPKHRAYALLRTHGSGKGPNRRRIITRDALERALEQPAS